MADVFSPEQRSRVMRQVKSQDTSTEMTIRRMVWRMGFRYRLHRKDLPGAPDLVFVGKRKIIFVHGCFWHGHDCTRGGRIPKSNRDYWLTKIGKNRTRDRGYQTALQEAGWKVMIVWECELKNKEAIAEKLYIFLANTTG